MARHWNTALEPTGLGGAEGVSTEDVGNLAGQGALEGGVRRSMREELQGTCLAPKIKWDLMGQIWVDFDSSYKVCECNAKKNKHMGDT